MTTGKRVQFTCEQVEELRKAYKGEKDTTLVRKSGCLWEVSKGRTAKEVAQEKEIGYSTILLWIKRYKEQGIEGLEDKRVNSGVRMRLTEQEQEQVKQWSREGKIRTLKEGRELIINEFGKVYHVGGLWYTFKSLGLVCKSGRKKHVKADEKEQERYKKRGLIESFKGCMEKKREIRGYNNIGVWFLDEARVGLMVNYCRLWCPKGERVRVGYITRYKWAYLGLAAEVTRGKMEAIWLDWINKEGVEIFLKQLRQTYKDMFMIIAMDRAGWHKNLKVPEGMIVVELPAYSPELNPIENMIKSIRQTTANRCYETLQEKMQEIEQKLRSWWEYPQLVCSTIRYPWIVEQVKQIKKIFYNLRR